MRPILFAACLALTACHASPPPTSGDNAADSKPAPAKPAEEHTELRDAIQAPIDKAKSVDAIQQESDEARKKAIDDAGG